MLDNIPQVVGKTANPLKHFKKQVEANPYLNPEMLNGLTVFALLPGGRCLYPAYYLLRHNECYRRKMGHWDGNTGEIVGVTLAGQLYRQEKLWGNAEPDPHKWEKFSV